MDDLTSAEIEVWEQIKSNLENMFSGEKKKYLDFLHENFTGWSYDELLPVKKSSIQSELNSNSNSIDKEEILFEIFPLSVKVVENSAVVHYLYSSKTTNKENKRIQNNVRLTDLLVKQKGKWFLLGDHIGFLNK